MIVRVNVKDNGRFSIEFAKSESDDSFYVVKGNKIVTKSDGSCFISGPSFKGDEGWVNWTYADQSFQDYVIGLVKDATKTKEEVSPPSDDDIPF